MYGCFFVFSARFDELFTQYRIDTRYVYAYRKRNNYIYSLLYDILSVQTRAL